MSLACRSPYSQKLYEAVSSEGDERNRRRMDSSLEQTTFGPNARGNARDRWKDKVDLVLVRSQFGEIDLASRSYNLRIELVSLLGL
jgi:hypothetical protein